MKKIFILQFIFFLFNVGTSKMYASDIDFLIKNQIDFDNLNNKLNETVKKLPANNDQTINIIFSKGIYKFNNSNEIVLSNVSNKGLILNITAKDKDNVYIISDGNEYTVNKSTSHTSTHYFLPLKSSYTQGEVYVDQNFHSIPTSDSGELNPSGMNQATTEISIADTTKKIAKLGIPQELAYIKNKGVDFFKNSIIYWKSWFITKYGTIDHSDNTYLYFNYDSNYILNGDFSFSKQPALFYITNISNKLNENKIFIKNNMVYIPINIKKLYEFKYQTILNFSNVHFKGITISNLTFCGSALFNPFYHTVSLLAFKSTDNVTINNNTFKNLGNSVGINNDALNLDYNTFSSQNFLFFNNKASDLYGNLVSSTVENSTIKNNIVENSGIFYKNGGTILVSGKNYYIANNVIKNSAYIGLFIGKIRTADYKISGIVELNEVFNDQDYLNNYIRNTIMDGGGIYIFTHNDSTICRYNIVHDIKGRLRYRGIFCDDGAYNVQLIGNLIYNIDNNYAIDSRYESVSVVKPPFYTSTNNIMANNVLTGNYRFQGNPAYSMSSKLGTNYIIGSGNNANAISRVNVLAKDIVDKDAIIKDGKIYINNKQDLFKLNLPEFILNRIVLETH